MSGAALNSHDVHQYEASINGSWFYGATRNIGQAFNPTLAMINHSCDPNSVHYNIAKATISVATRNIAKGEEVFQNSFIFVNSISLGLKQNLSYVIVMYNITFSGFFLSIYSLASEYY